MVRRVPIAGEINRATLDVESVEIPEEDRNDVVSAADAERSTGEEIALDVRKE
jgi:predicted HAD superfamily phosphohydrolase